MWTDLFNRVFRRRREQPNEDRPIHKAAQESAESLKTFLDRKPSLRDEPGWFSRQGHLDSEERLMLRAHIGLGAETLQNVARRGICVGGNPDSVGQRPPSR